MKTILFFCLALFALSPKAQTIYTVTKTTDPDPFVYPYDYEDSLCDPEMYGTLQWAIRKANDTQDSVKIVFNINQSQPDIILNFALPVITNKVYIDGTTQQGYLSGHPIIKITGGGIKVQANGCKFKGLYIEQNNYNGIQCYSADYTEITECVINKINTANAITYIGEGAVSIYNSSHCKITNNYIGTDADSCTCYYPDILTSSCRNGINIVSYPLSLKTRPSNYNLIKNNTIANCSQKAIWIQENCKYNRISENKIYQSYRAIVLNGNGNENKQPPVISYFHNDTLYGTSQPDDIIEVFGSTGDQQANQFLGSVITDVNGNWSFYVQTMYSYVVVSATDESGNSSSFSLKYNIKACEGSICFESPNQPHCTSIPYPTWCTNKTICLGDIVKIYFCEMCGGLNEWHVILNATGHEPFSDNLDFNTFEGHEGIYEVWSTTFIPQTAGNYNLILYLYNDDTPNYNFPYYLTLNILPLPLPIITQNPILCEGSSSTLDAGAGYSQYSWSTGESTQTIIINDPETYSVTVTDENGCTGTTSINVTQQQSPWVNISGNVCNNPISLTAQTNATNFLWSTNATSQSINVNQPGTYSVTVTNTAGCTNTASITVTQNSPINLQINTASATCFGASNGSATVNASGGTLPYNYLWSNGSTGTTANNLSAGTYSVTVTDANGCTATTQVTITQPPQIQYTANVTNVSCFAGNNGSICLSVSGGTPFHLPPFNFPYYHYQWNNGATNNCVYNLIAGTYFCTITDAAGCTGVATVVVSQPAKMQATFTSVQPTCFGYNNGSVTVNATGGTPPYTYQWNNGAQVNYINHQTAGNYSVTVTDAHGCSTAFNTILTQPTKMTLEINAPAQLCSNATGTVIATAGGGIPPYSYNWNGSNPPYPNSNQINVTTGNYQVTVTDINGCTVNQSFTINTSNEFTVNANVTQQNGCSPGCSAAIEITVEPLGNYTYVWDNGEYLIHSQNLHNICPGTYFLTVTDANGCSLTNLYNIDYIEGTTCGNPSGNMVISQNTRIINNQIFDSNGNLLGSIYDVPGNIIVNGPVGTTLDIRMTPVLRFKPNAFIQVFPGCTLTISNSKITSCDAICPRMWYGIKATSGNADKPIYVHISDGAIIENAKYGVYAYKNSGTNYVYIYSDGAHYINNWIDLFIQRTPYDHHIVNNMFITNNNYIQSAFDQQFVNPNRHIFLDQNSAIQHLENNQFKNEKIFTVNTDPSTRGYGIYSQKTIIKNVDSYFEGLYYGFFSNSVSNIAENTFYNNNRAIHLYSNTAAGSIVYSNVFTVGNFGYQNNIASINYGIGLYNLPQFYVYENTIRNGLIGIYTNNTVNYGNVIYNNTFDNLYVACLANGNNQVLYNCNIFSNQTTAYGQYLSYPGGDMVVYPDGSTVFNPQTKYGTFDLSTYNKVDQQNCTTNPSKIFFNATNNNYTYYYCNDGDVTDISNCSAQVAGYTGTVDAQADINTIDYYGSVNQYCPLGPPIALGGNKSLAASFVTADSLIAVKQYQQQALQALVDNGNTAYFLNKIAALAPNNFNKLYNELMDASPYLSDTVLISFMIHPINQPAHKKNVVLANSPLPYRVRPYINQMNVNQNFKNQIWAAQQGLPNARVQTEHYIQWLSNRRQIEVAGMLYQTIDDTLGYKTDSLIAYLGNSTVLDDRIVRYSLLIKKNDYHTALSELDAIVGLTDEIPLVRQQQFEEFADVAGVFIQSLQADTLADSVIIEHQNMLEQIASEEFHIAQTDAKSLLEKIGIPQPYYAWLPEGGMAKKTVISEAPKAELTACETLIIQPNPSQGIINVQYHIDDNTNAKLHLTTNDGKVIDIFRLAENTNEIQINCNTCTAGKYLLTLYINGEPACSKSLIITK